MTNYYLRLRHKLEFLFFRFFVAFLGWLPEQWLHRCAKTLGYLLFAADNRRRDIACNNIRIAGIYTDERSIRQTARLANVHFLAVVMGALRAYGHIRKDAQPQITWDIAPETRALLETPQQGLILCSGHIGNWEVGIRELSQIKPVVGIARPMNNPLVESFMQKRAGGNLEITPKHHADVGRLMRPLYDGKILAILFDQHAPHQQGMMIDFFGKPASTYTSPAMLHLVTGIPLCFGVCRQTGQNSYVMKLDAPLATARSGNRKQDVAHIMGALHKKLEQAIRRAPEQYLWSHRRWRQTQASNLDSAVR